jgi:hypothetical protein
MGFPDFFDAVPGIVLRDPLAEFLGAAEGGLIEYRYADAVRLAGHSCPTVAGAYLLTCRALRALHGEAVPERGGLRVDFRDARANGVTGVIAGVVGLLTGAAGDGGFKGLAGRFSRRDLLAFEAEVPGEIRFTRLDSGAAVTATLQLGHVPADPRMGGLLQRILAGEGDAPMLQEFATLWQERVRRILIEHFDDPRLVALA